MDTLAVVDWSCNGVHLQMLLGKGDALMIASRYLAVVGRGAMDRNEAAAAFLAKIHGLVSDYLSGEAPAGPLPAAIRRIWAEERARRAPSGLDTGTIRTFAARQYADIDLSWPIEKPPSVQMLQGALQEVVTLCDDSGVGANGRRN